MDLPIELWHLIVYNLKFNVDLYKNGLLVNKLLYKIVKNIYDKIPTEIYIKFIPIHNIPDVNKLIKSEILYPIYEDSRYEIKLINGSFKVHKNELLLKKIVKFSLYGNDQYHYNLHLPIENCFNENLHQKFYVISLDDYHFDDKLRVLHYTR